MQNKKVDKKLVAIFFAILAAAFYGLSSPVSKILLAKIGPTFLASLLYLGAALGMLIIKFYNKLKNKEEIEARLTKKELPYTIAMIVLDILAPIFLLIGLKTTNPETTSLLNNFEIVATSMIALVFFKEAIGKRMWIAIVFITLASISLSFSSITNLNFTKGSIFILLACVCWGLENNTTRMLSLKNPLEIVLIKGLGSGIGSLLIAIYLKEAKGDILYILIALILGMLAYGLSIFFYIKAQRELGASRTSAYYAVSPFIGVILSFIIFNEPLTTNFVIGLILMLIGSYFAFSENHNHEHIHEVLTHEHVHTHDDKHHNHTHNESVDGAHSHVHTHEKLVHSHKHTPDLHHNHSH